MKLRTSIFTGVLALSLLAGGLGTACADAEIPGVIRTTNQGVHRMNVPGGQLIVVTGTYQDTTAYKRSLSFFFQKNGDPVLQHVPIAEDKDTLTTEWFHLTREETTLSDAAVIKKGRDIFLIIVERDPGKRAFKTTRYRFQKSGDTYPDAPALLFAPQSSNTASGTKKDTVETILGRETGRAAND